MYVVQLLAMLLLAQHFSCPYLHIHGGCWPSLNFWVWLGKQIGFKVYQSFRSSSVHLDIMNPRKLSERIKLFLWPPAKARVVSYMHYAGDNNDLALPLVWSIIRSTYFELKYATLHLDHMTGSQETKAWSTVHLANAVLLILGGKFYFWTWRWFQGKFYKLLS